MTWGSDPLISGRGDLGPYGLPDNTIDLGDYLVQGVFEPVERRLSP